MTATLPVVINPTAGGGRLLRQRRSLEAVAAARGVTLEWWQTSRPGHATELGRQAAARELPLVLAFGGDGTYNETARGLLGSDTALGVLPGGTTSVLAYELGIPRPPPRALAALLDGSNRAMRIGCTNRGDVFLLMLSAGPDALVLNRLFPLFKRLGGRVGIALQAVVETVRARLPQLRVRCGDGRSIDGSWAVLGNSRCYGGPFEATPAADPFSDRLDLVLLQGLGRRAAIPFVFGIATGRHVRRADVVQRPCSRVQLEPLPGFEVPYQVDGDQVGMLPVEASIDPRSLLVRLPPPLAGETLTVNQELLATR